MKAPSSTYLIDSDVLMQAHRMYYAFDICPGFWESILFHHGQNRIFCINQVKDEIKGGDKDALYKWAHDVAPAELFSSTEDPVIAECYARIIRWVQSEKFTEAAKEEYAKSADGWIIAYAKAKGYTVVTSETFEKDRRNKVKIPNACKQFDVPCIDTFSMLRSLSTRFDWKQP
jgi:hypothetical protein